MEVADGVYDMLGGVESGAATAVPIVADRSPSRIAYFRIVLEAVTETFCKTVV